MGSVHGLDCAKGGLVKKGHNDLRDSDARIADVAWGGVAIEPILVPENDKKGRPMLQADWMVRGVYVDTPSYAKANLSWESVFARAATAKKTKYRFCPAATAKKTKYRFCPAATAKKTKYRLAAEELCGSFTPLVCSTDGVLHREYIAYLKRLACHLTSKWQKPFSAVMAWVRIHMQFAIFWSVDLRLCGTRRRIWGLGLQDGAAIGVGH